MKIRTVTTTTVQLKAREVEILRRFMARTVTSLYLQTADSVPLHELLAAAITDQIGVDDGQPHEVRRYKTGRVNPVTAAQ